MKHLWRQLYICLRLKGRVYFVQYMESGCRRCSSLRNHPPMTLLIGSLTATGKHSSTMCFAFRSSSERKKPCEREDNMVGSVE